jgi:hypothetical protein
MDNTNIFLTNSDNKLAPLWFRFCFLRLITESLRVISIVFLLSLISCNTTTIKNTKFIPTSTFTFNELPSSFISDQNISDLRPINEWNLYDINAIAWSIDSDMFALAGEENDDGNYGVYAYNIDTHEKLWFRKTYVPFSLVFSPDNQVIAVPFFAGFHLLDATTGESIKETLYQKATCFGSMGIRFSSDGKKIYTLSTSSDINNEHIEIFVWDMETDSCLGKLIEKNGVSFGFELSNDGRYLLIGLRDVKIQGHYEKQTIVWDTGTRQQVCSFAGDNPAFYLDGDWIAAANVDEKGEINLWNAKSCQVIGKFVREGQEIPQDIEFSPDGKLIAIGGDTLQIWTVASKKLLFESNKLSNYISILAFSPDGRFILTITPRISSNDKAKIVLWGIKP